MQARLVQQEMIMQAQMSKMQAQIEARVEVRFSKLENQLSLLHAESSSAKTVETPSAFVDVECIQYDDDMYVGSSAANTHAITDISCRRMCYIDTRSIASTTTQPSYPSWPAHTVYTAHTADKDIGSTDQLLHFNDESSPQIGGKSFGASSVRPPHTLPPQRDTKASRACADVGMADEASARTHSKHTVERV